VTRARIAWLHVVLPLVLGAASYVVLRSSVPLLGPHAPLWPGAPAVVRDHFADAAWAWALGAFVSTMWRGERAARRLAWTAGAALVAVLVECLQYAHVFRGVFDPVDLAVEVGAVVIAAWAAGGMKRWIDAPV
jgi:hypothetical protein